MDKKHIRTFWWACPSQANRWYLRGDFHDAEHGEVHVMYAIIYKTGPEYILDYGISNGEGAGFPSFEEAKAVGELIHAERKENKWK